MSSSFVYPAFHDLPYRVLNSLIQNEDHDTSDEMSRIFLELKRDIDAFSTRIDRYLEETGTQLDAAAAALQPVIQSLRDQISV